MKRFLRSDRGVAAIEAAFIFPIMIVLYIGLIDLTRMITLNRKLTAVAASVSDTVSQYQSIVTAATVDDIFNVAGVIMQPTPSTSVHIDVYGFQAVGAGPTYSPNQYWKRSSVGGPTCPAPSQANFSNLMTAGNDLVVAVTCYTYQPFITTLFINSKQNYTIMNSTSYLMSQTLTSRPRASNALKCVTIAGGTVAC